jgi:phosphoribosylaminoimidazole (AIR) synthetase
MGCGFVCVVPADRAQDAVDGLAEHHPGAAVIGEVTDEGGTVAVPSLGITGSKAGLRAT